VTDDSGSIGCSVDCGWEGITVELVAEVILPEDIVWVS
jgi:hypothetical protein